MQATLDALSLKPFTKAITCLSRYGDELTIYATSDSLSLSATNSSKSAYCRFKYEKHFFSRFSVGEPHSVTAARNDSEQPISITGQMLTKSLLSILRHRTTEKTVDRCELSIIEEGNAPSNDETPDENKDGLESRLVVRLQCKHGVIKTHRLLLLMPTSLMAPGVPDAFNESNLTIGPKSVKDMIEHFPLAKGVKSDPQLIWSFGESEVELKSLESSVGAQGMAQLATELRISSEEFDVYNIYAPPTTIAFHLREFNATIAFADSMAHSLDFRFTDPAAPLFIDVEGDNMEALFVISTSQVHGAITGVPNQHYYPLGTKKREREETPIEQARIKKPMKAAQRLDQMNSQSMTLPHNSQLASTLAIQQSTSEGPSMPPPSLIPVVQSTPLQPSVQPPLFWPSSSQLSVVDEALLRESGLGIEEMDAEELANMLEGEGEEVAFDFSSQRPTSMKDTDSGEGVESFEIEGEPELAPTQTSSPSKFFQPLFED